MRVLIAGGGIGGLVAALCLHAAGVDVPFTNPWRSCGRWASASTCCRTPSAF